MTLEILIALVIGGLILLRLAFMFDRACKRLDQIEEHLRLATGQEIRKGEMMDSEAREYWLGLWWSAFGFGLGFWCAAMLV